MRNIAFLHGGYVQHVPRCWLILDSARTDVAKGSAASSVKQRQSCVIVRSRGQAPATRRLA